MRWGGGKVNLENQVEKEQERKDLQKKKGRDRITTKKTRKDNTTGMRKRLIALCGRDFRV